MADYVLSNRADNDLGGIYAYSFREFGEEQADAYFAKLVASLNSLAESPRQGRSAESLHPGLFRYDCAAHVIFYTETENGIFVVRILHHGMDMPRHV